MNVSATRLRHFAYIYAVSHRYQTILMLTKRQKYRYDDQAVRLPRRSVALYTRDHRRTWDGEPPTDKAVSDVWEFATESHVAHPAPFPEELPDRCLSLSGFAGARVLDRFDGSGTVGVVARRQSMGFTLIELNQEYCALARKRIAAAPGPQPNREAAD